MLRVHHHLQVCTCVLYLKTTFHDTHNFEDLILNLAPCPSLSVIKRKPLYPPLLFHPGKFCVRSCASREGRKRAVRARLYQGKFMIIPLFMSLRRKMYRGRRCCLLQRAAGASDPSREMSSWGRREMSRARTFSQNNCKILNCVAETVKKCYLLQG